MEIKQFNFGEALSFLKSGLKVTNGRGNIYFMENNKSVLYPLKPSTLRAEEKK